MNILTKEVEVAKGKSWGTVVFNLDLCMFVSSSFLAVLFLRLIIWKHFWKDETNKLDLNVSDFSEGAFLINQHRIILTYIFLEVNFLIS